MAINRYQFKKIFFIKIIAPFNSISIGSLNDQHVYMNEEELRWRKQALEDDNDPMDNNLSNHEDTEMEIDKDGRKWIMVSRAIRRYKASIRVPHGSICDTA